MCLILVILNNSILGNFTYSFKSQLWCYFFQKNLLLIRSKLYVCPLTGLPQYPELSSAVTSLAMLSFLFTSLFATLDSELHQGRNIVCLMLHHTLISQYMAWDMIGSIKD